MKDFNVLNVSLYVLELVNHCCLTPLAYSVERPELLEPLELLEQSGPDCCLLPIRLPQARSQITDSGPTPLLGKARYQFTNEQRGSKLRTVFAFTLLYPLAQPSSPGLKSLTCGR